MCGIVYNHNMSGNPVNNNILQMFDNQRSRGTEGFGLFDGQETNMVHATKEDKILKWLVKYDSNLILFHHRNPTSTINVKRASHPFSTKNYFGKTQYIMVHNGHITNSRELYKKHKEAGIEYKSLLQDGTFNDSEALLWDLSLYLEGKQKELTATGGIAFVCLKLEGGKLVKMHFGRNTNPLNLLRTKDGISLSSEGEGEAIDRDVLHTYHYDSKYLTHKDLEIPRYESWTSYSTGYTATEYPKTQAWNPHQTYANYDYYDDYLNDEWEEELEFARYNYVPKKSEVEKEVIRYLVEAKGVFEDAYQLMEKDYWELEVAKPITTSEVERLVLTENVMEALCNDPEYTSDYAISSKWEAIWED